MWLSSNRKGIVFVVISDTPNMLGEISSIYCLRKRRVLAVASDSSGFATAVLSEVATKFELTIWLHVYGMVKVGTHEFGSHAQGKYIDIMSTQIIWHPWARKLCVVVDGLCTLMSYSWEDPVTGVSTSMLKAIKCTDEGLDTDFPPTGDFVNAKIRTICEVPHHIISACLGDNLHHIYLGMTGIVAKLSWDGYILCYHALNTETTLFKTSHEVCTYAMSTCKSSKSLDGVYVEENFKGVGCHIEIWSHTLGGLLAVSKTGSFRVICLTDGHSGAGSGKHSPPSSVLVASDNLEFAITTPGQEQVKKAGIVHLTKSLDYQGSCVVTNVASYDDASSVSEKRLVLVVHNLRAKRSGLGDVSLDARVLAVNCLTGAGAGSDDPFITFAKDGRPILAMAFVAELDSPRLLLVSGTKMKMMNITLPDSSNIHMDAAELDVAPASFLYSIDVACAAPAMGPVDAVTMAPAFGKLIITLSSALVTTGSSASTTHNSNCDTGSTIKTNNSTIHVCPLLLPVGGALSHPEVGSTTTSDMQSMRSGQNRGFFLLDTAQRTILTFHGETSRVGVTSESWLCNSSSNAGRAAENVKKQQFDCSALQCAEPAAAITGKLCRVPLPAPLYQELVDHMSRYSARKAVSTVSVATDIDEGSGAQHFQNSLGNYSMSGYGGVYSGMVMASSDTGGKSGGHHNGGCSGSTGQYYALSFGMWPLPSMCDNTSTESSRTPKQNNDSISVWLCNAYSQQWQSVDFAVGGSQKDSRATVVQVPLSKCVGMSSEEKPSVVHKQRERAFYGHLQHVLGLFWLQNHTLIMLTQRATKFSSGEPSPYHKYSLEVVSREFVKGKDRSSDFSYAGTSRRKPVPAVHKILPLPAYLSDLLSQSGSVGVSGDIQKDYCFEVLANPHLSHASDTTNGTTASVVIGCDTSFAAYQVSAETANGSVKDYSITSLWHIGSLGVALGGPAPSLPPTKTRAMLLADGEVGLALLGADKLVRLMRVESEVGMTRGRARKSLGGMEGETVAIEIEVGRVVISPLAPQFGRVRSIYTVPCFSLVDTTVINGGLTPAAGATAILLSLYHQRRSLLWLPLPLGVTDTLSPADRSNESLSSVYSQLGGLLLPLPILLDQGSTLLGISAGMLLNAQQRLGLLSGYALAAPRSLRNPYGAAEDQSKEEGTRNDGAELPPVPPLLDDEDNTVIRGAASTALSAISSAGGGVHVHAQSVSCSIMLHLAALYRNNTAVWLARGLLRVLKGECFRGEVPDVPEASHLGGQTGEFASSSALFHFVDALEECLMYLLLQEGKPSKISMHRKLQLEKKQNKKGFLDFAGSMAMSPDKEGAMEAHLSLKESLTYSILIRFLYAVDPLLLTELLSSIGRRMEPGTTAKLVPVALRGHDSHHEFRSPLSLYEECLLRGWHRRASRLLTLACSYVGGVESVSSTLESLALALELLSGCMESCEVVLARECLGFCSRLESMLESAVKSSPEGRGGTREANSQGLLGRALDITTRATGAPLWGFVQRIDSELSPELKGLTAASKMNGSNVKTVKQRIRGASDGSAAFAQVKQAMSAGRLHAILESPSGGDGAPRSRQGIYDGPSFSSTLVILRLESLMALRQYCAVAAVAHGLIGLSQARNLLRGHVSTSTEEGAVEGRKEVSKEVLLALRSLGLDSSSCEGGGAGDTVPTLWPAIDSQLAHQVGGSFMLAACRLERERVDERNQKDGKQEGPEQGKQDFYGVSRSLACDVLSTRGDLLVALLTVFFLTGKYRAAASLCVIAGGLNHLAASLYQLDLPTFCSAVSSKALRDAVAMALLPVEERSTSSSDANCGRATLASLRVKQASLSSLVFLATVTNTSDEGRIGGTISSEEEIGSKYMKRVATSLDRARVEGVAAGTGHALVCERLGDDEWVGDLMSLRAVTLG